MKKTPLFLQGPCDTAGIHETKVPITLARKRTETRFAFNNYLHKWTKLSDLFTVRAMVLLRELITNPQNVSSCVGINTDFTG